MPSFTKTVSYADVDLTVNFYASKPVPARLSGPPEDCYPAEGELNILSLTTDAPSHLQALVDDYLQTSDMQERIYEAAWEHFHELRNEPPEID